MPSLRHLILMLCLLGCAGFLSAQDASVDELRQKLAALQAEVEQLQGQGTPDARLLELERRIDLLAAELEKTRTGGASEAEADQASEPGLAPAASKVYRTARGISIGGYGEALYTRSSREDQSGRPSNGADKLDFLRSIVYVGYKFSDKILFNSELEVEHATTGEGDEEKGEVSLELGYLEFKPWKQAGLRSGMLLIPLGFTNELHEPPVFHGAQRPEVERVIIPTTWHEVGLGAFGEHGPLQWRAYVVAGLDSAGFEDSGLKEGRQQGAESLARDLAFTGRLDYAGVPGLLIGAGLFTGESGQGAELDGAPLRARVTLFEFHGQYEHRGLRVRALYARTRLGDAALINARNGLFGDESVGERQYGGYVEAAYDVLNGRGDGRWSLTPFVRYERLDTQQRVPGGFERNPARDRTGLTFGVDLKPLPSVVLKADFQRFTDRARSGVSQFHLAMGYLF